MSGPDRALELIGLDSQRARDERFLVTGSEGCIGAWTVRTLVEAGCVTVAADLPPHGRRIHQVLDQALHERVIHVDANIARDGVVDALIAEHSLTRVVHLAALQVPLVRADPVLGATVNVGGTVRLLEAVRQSDGQVRGVAYASSTAAVGLGGEQHLPATLYGAFKLCNEHTARLYASDFRTPSVGLRPCVVYGPARDQGLTAALTHALKAVALGVPYEVPFTGLVDAQFTEDVAVAFVRSALLDGNDGAPVYDLHGAAVSVEDFIAAVIAVAPEAEDLLSCAGDPIPAVVDVDDGALVSRLGSLPKTSLSDGIRCSLETFHAQVHAGQLSATDLPG